MYVCMYVLHNKIRMYFILFSKTRFTLSCFVTEFLVSLRKGDTKTPRMILISELVRRQEDVRNSTCL